jgi:hypothetical protein
VEALILKLMYSKISTQIYRSKKRVNDEMFKVIDFISSLSQSVSEIHFRESLGLFQKKADNLKHEYNDKLKKI